MTYLRGGLAPACVLFHQHFTRKLKAVKSGRIYFYADASFWKLRLNLPKKKEESTAIFN